MRSSRPITYLRVQLPASWLNRIATCAIPALLLSVSPHALAEDRPAHHAKRAFTNPYAEKGSAGFFGFLRARLLSGDWAGYDEDRYQVPTAEPKPVSPGDTSSNAAVTWIGHATVLIQHRGINVITDPMLSQYASPVSFAGPKRITQPGIALDELPPIDVVVISHDHYDHLDAKTVRALGNGPRYFVPLGIKSWLERKGIAGDRVTEMDWWDSEVHDLEDERVTITATPSQHFSGRGVIRRDRTLWASWAISWDDFTVWFAGDTGYNDAQFKEIGRRIPRIDLGIIPIGAYEPRWFMGTVHVNPAEAVAIHTDIGAHASMGIHWGTFMLSAEDVGATPGVLLDATADAGLPSAAFTTFAIGETRRYKQRPASFPVQPGM